MKHDWDRHLKIGANMRKEEKMPPVDEVLGHGSKMKSKTVGSEFDSASYISQLEGSVGEGSAVSGGSPIKTMAEFRKHVISTKKMAASQANLNQGSLAGKGSVNSGGFEMTHNM